MGRGNVCTLGKYEGLFYIDNDHIHVYRATDDYSDDPETRLMGELGYDELTNGDWYYDEEGTMSEEDDIIECFIAEFTGRFSSFSRTDDWLDRTRRVILESKLFYICVEDNEWSLAVELVQKEEPYGMVWMENLQGRLYQTYLEGIKRCLLTRLPSIGTRKTAWTSGQITREEVLGT
jgi:hypothetical protein